MSDESKLFSSALNGITAYEDNDEKRIRNEDIVKFNNLDLKESLKRVSKLINEKIDKIISFIDGIPEEFDGIKIISSLRKQYYINTFKIRFNEILLKAI